ncbi:MAG TPA: hypothetical protein EYP04_09335, partial [Anaerolineae bacterium]|nr:hypothetical protein [Anaerolineae bacterium]
MSESFRWVLPFSLLALIPLTACGPTPTIAPPTAPQSPVLNIAHRGARSLAPENTLAAARKALAIGADMWELDVQMTSDGQLIVMHDSSLERTCNVEELFPDRRPWLVAEFTLAEIQKLDCGSWFNETDPFGQIKARVVSPQEQQSYVGERAPTLREALLFTRDHDWRVNVEIKDLSRLPGDATVVEKVVDLIVELDMVDRVVISSFNYDYLRRVRAANGDIPTAALT